MQHIRKLDGLRFVAVMLVLVEHFAYFFGQHFSAGYYGVDLFFVISGFLITLILQKSTQSFPLAYKNFIARRTLRIFPLYYAVLILFLILGDNSMRTNFPYFASYTYNYAIDYGYAELSYFQHFWTLCVEEQFYLLYPVLFLALRKHLFVFRVVLILLVVACSCQFLFDFAHLPGNQRGLFPRANSILVGCLGASFCGQVTPQHPFLKSKVVEFVAFVALLACLLNPSPINHVVCPLISLFFIIKATYIGFSIKPVDDFLGKNLVVKIGTISYGIYIFHLPVAHYFNEYFFNPFIWENIDWNNAGILRKLKWQSWLIKFPLYSMIVIFLASLSYKYFERPILSAKDKWFKN